MTPQEHETMSKCDWHGGTYAGREMSRSVEAKCIEAREATMFWEGQSTLVVDEYALFS